MAKRESLRRRRPYLNRRQRILIVCEGTRTEPNYFQEFKCLCRSPLCLDRRPGGKPMELVERAVRLKTEAAELARRSRDWNLRYDGVWCVFDVDEHPLLAEARRLADANGIQLAVSNPSFELWFLLHYQDQRPHIGRDQVRRRLRKYVPNYEKTISCEALLPLFEAAVQRAQDLEDWQMQQGRAGGNPSTGVHHLVELIRQSGRSRTWPTAAEPR